jgi:hypothetical protein
MDRVSPFFRLVEHLGGVRGRRAHQLMLRWGEACPLLAKAGLGGPPEVPAWVSGLGRTDPEAADEVVRSLIGLAQSGDRVAAVTVLVCLRWGMCALASREEAPVEEVLAEASLVLLEFPVERRRRVMAGLLLDTRNRMWRQRQKLSREPACGDLREQADQQEAPGDLGVQRSAGEELVDVIRDAWRTDRLREDDARLIIETRVLGDEVAVAAARRSLTRNAAYLRRSRAEASLTGHLAA